MSTECCSSSPRLNYYQFLEDITWLNEDYPEANQALLEGIRTGMAGYDIDNIIENQSAKRMNSRAKLSGCDLRSSTTVNKMNVADPAKPAKIEHNLETMEHVLQETATLSPLPRTDNTSPNGHLKRNSALTVRPKSIGEERKAWLLEARRACCLNELQSSRFLNSTSEMFYRNSVAHSVQQLLSANFFNESISVSCPDLEISRREHMQQYESEDTSGRRPKDAHDHHDISTASIDEKDSCEFLFQHVEGCCFKPSKIRLSPRIEKLDKLIPKTSKEFLNTMRIVNTISPQPSEEQLNSLQSMHSVEENLKIESSKSETNQQTEDSDEMEETHVELEHHHPCSDGDASGNRLTGMVCRSYKEVCIYGPHSSSGPNSSSVSSDQTSEKVVNETTRANTSQSASGFPSLPKLVKSGSGLNGDETQKTAPPLYSSILQRSPTCIHGCGEGNCVDSQLHVISHQAAKVKGKTSPITQSSSPPLPLGSFDCGFCRTNNEPESVYRSHPLRVNDIVICPSLRKYVCCFCGATGDKAHTIKYCPKNPIGFFAKKTRNSPVAPMMTVEKNTKGITTSTEQTAQPVQSSPVKGKEKEAKNVVPVSKEPVTQTDQESKSDSEIAAVVEESSEPVKRSSGNWIEAKTKGRKKKNGK